MSGGRGELQGGPLSLLRAIHVTLNLKSGRSESTFYSQSFFGTDAMAAPGRHALVESRQIQGWRCTQISDEREM